MKNTTLLIITLLLSSIVANGQNGFSVMPDTFDESYNEDLSNVSYIRSAAFMENSAASTLIINWEIINIDLPLQWGLSVSDKDISYAPGPPFAAKNFNPIEFNPGDSDIPFNVDIYHKQIAGCGSFQVLVTLDEDGSVLDTIDYKISINDDNCLTSEVENISFNKQIELFPNPFVDEIKLLSESTYEKITIYNLHGATLISQNTPSQSLNLSHLDRGIYFLEFVFANGQREVKKVIKKI